MVATGYILSVLFDKARLEDEEDLMSHHYSGADFGFPLGDARLDYCDLYAFPKPEDTNRSILIMDVHPSKALPEGATTTEPFAPEAIYELRIDTDGDLVADITYRFRFSPSENGAQTATVRRVEGADGAEEGDGGEAIIEGAPVSSGPEAQVTQAGEYRFFAGWRSDPFFYDAGGGLNDFQFTGDDFFADADVCSMVLELPNGELGDGEVALWHRTLVQADDANWTQSSGGLEPKSSPFSSRTRRRMHTSARSRQMTLASSTCWPTRWSTLAGTLRRRPRGWRGPCCRTSSDTTPSARLPTRTTAAR